MATKTKATKESALKAAKISPPVPVPEKKVAVKAKKTVAPTSKPAPVEASKASKRISKAKPQSSVTEPVKPAAIVTATAEPAPPPALSAASPDKRWQEIRLILEKMKEETLREIRKSVKNGTEAVAAIEPGGDIYDQASSERDRELGLLLGDREREKIHSIDEALLRIDEGEYGICEECDEDIPLGRLKAMPFTRHCVKCKSDLEKLQAQTKRVEEERAYREIPLGAEEEES